ncbi:hypothetical protein ABZ424_24020, partial [Streptomyces sp. NPDC005790]|uniref:hypothetical protein n=1 Tax=Streptomyces sp. NPDC005790 TaxID=3154777 RepID=UPI0033EFAF53
MATGLCSCGVTGGIVEWSDWQVPVDDMVRRIDDDPLIALDVQGFSADPAAYCTAADRPGRPQGERCVPARAGHRDVPQPGEGHGDDRPVTGEGLPDHRAAPAL